MLKKWMILGDESECSLHHVPCVVPPATSIIIYVDNYSK